RGTTIFPGPIDPTVLAHTTLASQFNLGDPAHRSMVGRLLADKVGLPGLLLLCGSLGIVLKPARLLRRPVLIVFGLVVRGAAIYVTSPYSAVLDMRGTGLSRAGLGENLRYALPAFGMLGVTGATGAAELVGPLGALVASLAVVTTSTSARTLPAALLVTFGAA